MKLIVCERTPAPAKPSTLHWGYPPIDEKLVGFLDRQKTELVGFLDRQKTELVGFDHHAGRIIDQLVGWRKNLDIISIVGMAGLGKTALARKVYSDSSIRRLFDVQAWCTVSQLYNRRKLLLEILEQITGDKHVTHIGDDKIADRLRRRLKGRRYLIVLDDIWEVKAWDELQSCFLDSCNESRIMITTRDEKVAMQIAKYSQSNPYFLPFLKDEESWELLQKKVFQRESCPSELLNVGPLVAKKCKGLPFLINMIAGILSKKERKASLWLEVAYDISSHTLEEESMKMIQSSYDHLADHLKTCLLYMGLFPKGYEIPVSDLLKWWIAEEFVQNIDTLELEKTSKSCLNDLVSRNLIVVSKRRANGEMKCCIVLDQVREFCLRKIREEKFMQLIGPYNPHQPIDSKRLCMYIQNTMRINSKERESSGESQGSLEFIVHPKFSILNSKNPFRLLSNLGCVRVLHLMDIYLDNSWAAAFQFQSLTHLRFLAIFVKVFNLKWVSHLLHLQTLQVRSSFTMISAAIWKMTKLRHVDISEFSITWEDDERVNFEESPDIVLDNLKTLGMCYMSVADMTPKFWAKFPKLEELSLHIDEFGDVPNSNSPLMSLEMFPLHLRVLSLNEIFLTCEIVSSIARLPLLETLKLSEITGVEYWYIDGIFYRLKFLKLHHVFMIKWERSEESFPLLETLVIKSCPKLEEIPLSFADIPTLRSITVIDCSRSVVISALDIKNFIEDNVGFDRLQVRIPKKSKDDASTKM